jgi:hypothetical protein
MLLPCVTLLSYLLHKKIKEEKKLRKSHAFAIRKEQGQRKSEYRDYKKKTRELGKMHDKLGIDFRKTVNELNATRDILIEVWNYYCDHGELKDTLEEHLPNAIKNRDTKEHILRCLELSSENYQAIGRIHRGPHTGKIVIQGEGDNVRIYTPFGSSTPEELAKANLEEIADIKVTFNEGFEKAEKEALNDRRKHN